MALLQNSNPEHFIEISHDSQVGIAISKLILNWLTIDQQLLESDSLVCIPALRTCCVMLGLGFSFLSCEVGKIIAPTKLEVERTKQDNTQGLWQGLAHCGCSINISYCYPCSCYFPLSLLSLHFSGIMAFTSFSLSHCLTPYFLGLAFHSQVTLVSPISPFFFSATCLDFSLTLLTTFSLASPPPQCFLDCSASLQECETALVTPFSFST